MDEEKDQVMGGGREGATELTGFKPLCSEVTKNIVSRKMVAIIKYLKVQDKNITL